MFPKCFLLFGLSLRFCQISSSSNGPHLDYFKEAESMYDKIYDDLKKKYDRRIRPFVGVKPVEVEVFLYISSLRSISEATMDYKLELYFREYWQDPRMAYNPKKYNNMSKISLHESYADLIWVPDTFLPNAVHSENPDPRSITHRALLRLEPDGHLLYSRRLSVTAECPMDLSLYPFDQQMCILSIESYGYGTEDIVYKWVKNEPIVLNPNLQLPDYKIKAVLTKSHNVTLATGVYSRLEACFFFVRSSAFYFVQLFIPATAIVITSWLSLCMEGESTFSDMVEVILAITFLYYSYNTMMPRVSYIKAMDIYLGACFIFVFLSLIKLAILKMMRFHGESEEMRHLRRNRRSFRGQLRNYERNCLIQNRCDPRPNQWKNHTESELDDNHLEISNHKPSTPNFSQFSTSTTAIVGQRNNVAEVKSKNTGSRFSKSSSRAALLHSTLSLDTTERFKKPNSALNRNYQHQNNANNVLRFFKSNRLSNFLGLKKKCRKSSTPQNNSRCVRFRKMYKRISVILFPLSFFGFCVYYFVQFFLLSEDISLTKCHF